MPVRRNTVSIKPSIIKFRQNVIQRNNTITEGKPLEEYNPINLIPSKRKRVFIIGGGASLCGFDFSKLKNEDTIAVNKAIDYIEHATYFITMDYTYLMKTNSNIDTINNKASNSYFIVNTGNSYIKKIDNVYTDVRFNLKYENLFKFKQVIESKTNINTSTGFSETINEFSNGNNSGFCALQLALLLGYEEIYLLGFDLCVNGNDTHFHNSYNQHPMKFSKNLEEFRQSFSQALNLTKHKCKIFSCSSISYLNNLIEYKDFNSIDLTHNPINKMSLSDLIVVGYYTINTPYQEEAQKLIQSCKRFNLNYDIIGVPNLGSWQSNTRFKAQFMLDMLDKHVDKRLLYVDCDAVFNSQPILFNNYSADIAVRYQDFSWRKNECLSGTIYMENNAKTRKLCKLWLERNRSEGPDAKTFEQWNLGAIIESMQVTDKLTVSNLPPEYTYIFDLMKKIYPDVNPVIEHFQKSRQFKNKV